MFRGLSNMLYTQTPKTKRLMAYHCNFDTINVVEHRSQGFHLRSMLLHLLHDCNVLKCLDLHCPGFEGWQRLNQNKCGYDNTCNILEEIGASWLHQVKCPNFLLKCPWALQNRQHRPNSNSFGLVSLGIFDGSIAKNTLAPLAGV